MIGAIHSNLQVNQTPETRRFDEGASATTTKVGAFVVSLLSAIASFVFLPAQAAFATTVGIAALFSLFCCCGSNGGAAAPQVEGQPVIMPSWYHRAWNQVPGWFRNRPTFHLRGGANVPVNNPPQAQAQNQGRFNAQPAGHFDARYNAQPAAAAYPAAAPIVPGAHQQVRPGGGHNQPHAVAALHPAINNQPPGGPQIRLAGYNGGAQQHQARPNVQGQNAAVGDNGRRR